MKYKLVVSVDAENDIEDAMDHYENQQKGLGKRYLLSVKVATKLIIQSPFGFAKIFMEIRKVNTQKFPYSLFYSIEEEQKEVVVFAVIHNSRSEKAWKKRIE